MRSSDIHAVLEIQSDCYTGGIPESAASLLAKLAASPSTCFVADHNGRSVGYLISLPWLFASPPRLNAESCRLPEDPDCLYLHDLAVAPVARGSGVGEALVEAFLGMLAALGFERAALVAVQNAGGYWRRQGFRPVQPSSTLAAKLASYGEGVEYMTRVVPCACPAG